MKKGFKKLLFILNNKASKTGGQITTEYLLLGVVLIILFKLSTDALKENDNLNKFIKTPQQLFENMVANGNWETGETSRRLHPNQFDSHRQSNGKGP